MSEEEANDYVFGYTIMNDISARDLQFQDGQWSRGKTADTFAPIGPVVVTHDEVGDPHELAISLELNGEMMQDSNTSNLIFTVPQIISFLSQSMTLKPGDLIATGTPPGVGMGRNPKVWLKNGDRMNVSIERIGTLSNQHLLPAQMIGAAGSINGSAVFAPEISVDLYNSFQKRH